MKCLFLCVVAVATFAAIVSAANIALNKPALQSSLYSALGPAPGYPKHGVDGVLETDYYKIACTHTLSEANAWWAVDLELVSDVKSVTIYNRKDCCSERLSNFDIIVTNKAPSKDSPPKVSDGLCAGQDGQPEDLKTFTCAKGTQGRYVIIRLRGKNFLTVCEVQVDGATANVALNQPTFQSSLYSALGPAPGYPKHAVDGILETDYYKIACTHTLSEKNAWWAVDLGESLTVKEVKIYNRKDCCSERLSNFDIFTSDSKPTATSSGGKCAGQDGQPADVATYKCDATAKGRYLVVRLRGTNFLTMCEVQVTAA